MTGRIMGIKPWILELAMTKALRDPDPTLSDAEQFCFGAASGGLWSWGEMLRAVREVNQSRAARDLKSIRFEGFPHDEADIERVADWRQANPRGAP